ncbi:hypothetical protein [Pendulispora albinea]|uniref:Uncharacterized protein n=1 Tax=Pendulispora albinea TaxID=2741071 RepID=A0ABZ2MC80_9BACT
MGPFAQARRERPQVVRRRDAQAGEQLVGGANAVGLELGQVLGAEPVGAEGAHGVVVPDEEEEIVEGEAPRPGGGGGLLADGVLGRWAEARSVPSICLKEIDILPTRVSFSSRSSQYWTCTSTPTSWPGSSTSRVADTV